MRRVRSWSSSAAATSDELNIVPFLDIVVNVVMYLLAVIAFVLATTELESSARRLAPVGSSAPLGLMVTVGGTGIHVVTASGALAAGCHDRGAAGVPALAPRDWAGLARCARSLATTHPGDDGLVLAADPEVPYEDVVAAMDALRPSFPDIQIAAGAR